MKTAIKYIMISLFVLGNSYSSTSQGWIQLDDFPASARDDGAFFTINAITYCGTGLNSTWNLTNDFYALDMTTASWSPIAGLPVTEARQYSCGFASSNRGFLFGGLNGTGYLNDLWTYDPTLDSWSMLTSMPAVGRSGASCFVIGDTAYIIGGQTAANSAISEVWAYSMTSDSWTLKNALPETRWRASAIAYEDKGYVLFGRDNDGIYRNEMYEYLPTTDSWNPLSNFPGLGRTYVGLAVLNDKLVSVAGRDSIGNSYNDMWEYSLVSDTWSISMNLPADQRRGGMCFYSSTAIYYSTGINLNDVRLTETWKFDLLLGVEDKKTEMISIYPNPAKDMIQISNSLSTGEFQYEISSILGTIVMSGKSNFDEAISIDDLERGNYLISIQTESKMYTHQFVKP